jgi:hypothetical protein
LLLNQQQFVFSSTCLEKGGNAEQCSKEQDKWSTINIDDELLQNIGKVAVFYHTLSSEGKLDKNNLEALIQCIGKDPYIYASFGYWYISHFARTFNV